MGSKKRSGRKGKNTLHESCYMFVFGFGVVFLAGLFWWLCAGEQSMNLSDLLGVSLMVGLSCGLIQLAMSYFFYSLGRGGNSGVNCCGNGCGGGECN